MTNDAEFIKDFLIESHENLDKIDAQLLVLEKNPSSPEALSDIFRAFHTIKGTSRFFQFSQIETVTHEGEDILSRLRDGRIVFGRSVADELLQLVDQLRGLLKNVESTGRDSTPEVKTAPEAPTADTILRVDVDTLDRLMAQIGELVLTRNQVLAKIPTDRDPQLLAAGQRLNTITTELQGQVMRMRLQPVESIWQKFPRVVRDLSIALGKEVNLAMEGGDTELDKSVLESIKDPLLHLVRNAIDHGIETPEERRRAGKRPAGQIRLRAWHEGGVVQIEVSDDGGGMASEAIRKKAVERGLLSMEAAAHVPDGELFSFIFLPGFSTAQKVTAVSGRGVGLDVVKTNIEKIGGSVDVKSAAGQGTFFRFKLPLTLAIVPALIVGVRGQRYAIPQADLSEMVRLKAGTLEWFQGAPVYRLRGRLLPVIFLDEVLGLPKSAETIEAPLAILRFGEGLFALAVNEVLDTEEIVVRPLGRHCKDIPVFDGAAVMGDGKVALVIDVAGLAHLTHVVKALENQPAAVPVEISLPKTSPESLLIFRGPDDGRMALPLGRILRLEEFPAQALEQAGKDEVVQYRGQILRVARVNSLLEERRRFTRRPEPWARPKERLYIVVCQSQEGMVGLLVDRILDISDEVPTSRRPGSRRGVASTVVLRGRVTELLDMEVLLTQAVQPNLEGAA